MASNPSRTANLARRACQALLAGACLPGHAQADRLQLRWMFSTGEQRTQWWRTIRDYRDESGTPDSRELEQSDYKERFEAMLRERPAPDVMFWFGGQRLREVVQQGLLAPLDALAEQDGWAQRFTRAALDAVRINGRLYALPLSTYAWGLYYRRSLFRERGLQPPSTWSQWLKVNDALRAAGVAPLMVGAQDSWTLGAWFDYLNLRLHGKRFHAELLAGRQSWSDPRVGKVLRHWQQLYLRGDFHPESAQQGWRQVLPYVSRGSVGMVLMGGFAAVQFPAAVRADLGFVRFPTLQSRVPLVENAPLDVLVLPAGSRRPQAAAAFLRHAARPAMLESLNNGMGLLPPLQQPALPPDELTQAAARVLAHTDESLQFFDRDSPTAFSGPALALFQEFASRPGQALAPLQARLEQLRLRALAATPPRPSA